MLGTKGEFWEVEYYDHLIRDERDLKAQLEYVLANPIKAGLQSWKWTSEARDRERSTGWGPQALPWGPPVGTAGTAVQQGKATGKMPVLQRQRKTSDA